MSLVRPALNLWLRATEKTHLLRAKTPEALRRSFELKAKLFFHGPRVARQWTSVGGVPALHLQPEIKQGPTLLYFHGGAQVFGSPETHAAMIATLAKRAGLPAVLPKYRLAPEDPHPAAFDDALAVYKDLASTGPVIIGGDSAGGGIALCLLAEILAQDLPKPLGVFAFSPLTSLAFDAPSTTFNADKDVVLPASRMQELAEKVLNGHPADDPRVSAIYGGFAGAPPVLLFAGDTEVLLDDTRLLAAKMREQGVAVEEVIERDLPHVWPLFHNLLPEARATLRQTSEWVTSLSQRSAGS